MSLNHAFKSINCKDAARMAEFFVKRDNIAELIIKEMNCAKTEEGIAHMTNGVFDLISVMQNVRSLDSGTYIRLTSKYMQSMGKYNFPPLYQLAMALDNNLKLAYVRDNWDKVEQKNPRLFDAMTRAYEELKRRADDYAQRGFYCELQCDFATSWTNGNPTYRHERVCDFYAHPRGAQNLVDSNPELIKWALLKLYEGYFVTFSMLAYSAQTKTSEVLTLGCCYGVFYEMVNNFGGRAITCLLPDLGANVHQISGDRYLALRCPKEARQGTVKCVDAQKPIFEM